MVVQRLALLAVATGGVAQVAAQAPPAAPAWQPLLPVTAPGNKDPDITVYASPYQGVHATYPTLKRYPRITSYAAPYSNITVRVDPRARPEAPIRSALELSATGSAVRSSQPGVAHGLKGIALPGMVDCGGHFEHSCSACPAGQGGAWCNGDCAWVSMGPVAQAGFCMPKESISLPGDGMQNLCHYAIFFASTAIIMLAYACVYNERVMKGPPALPRLRASSGGPRRGIFECFMYPETCLYATFCWPIVAAKNYYAAGICSFWPGCLLTFLGSFTPLLPFSLFIRALLSSRVQDKLRSGAKRNQLKDFAYAFFCFPCDVGRESLEVDQEVGAEIGCCCKVGYVVDPSMERMVAV